MTVDMTELVLNIMHQNVCNLFDECYFFRNFIGKLYGDILNIQPNIPLVKYQSLFLQLLDIDFHQFYWLRTIK